ncbi:MAG: enoyl-CoA hydratase/isomerase family protein [Rhodospirillales bacterium]|nr:enoyl-CoA hydratase/isomerase family protein [Rhodospirillales bacterium]
MGDYAFIEYAVRGKAAEITMNRPPVNAITKELAREVIDGYRRARIDDGVRAVILRSALDTVFSAGMDLRMARAVDGRGLRDFIEVFYFEMHEAQYRMGKPTIAAVTGHALAAGTTWAVSCDMIVAAEGVNFGYPEINVGVMPAMHLVHLPRQIGRHRAFEILFTGDPVPSAEMHRLGIVNHVAPKAEVLPTARAIAAKFAEKSPTAMRLMRDAWMRANDLDYRRNIENVVESMCLLRDHPDAQEALDAFVEHRAPKFKKG